ncbi:MAG: hypothetical protein A2X86_12565 [Bdellovibrionales bacterium GWA2_49_15]|nr:MAG: hypothetical protein A2X86_12565 [Bdellovibrionales bacterium GWA2_49_15]HAZ14685.1 hypothetical protein [Bdellovibrionales bacterium]
MLPCKEIVHILNSGESLSLMKKAELKMHLLMCQHCSSYATHLTIMKHRVKSLFAKTMRVDKEQIAEIEETVFKKLKEAERIAGRIRI